MPEIPDLEAIRGFLAARLPGQTVTAAEARLPWLVRSVDGLDSLVGHAFSAVRRYGKFLLLDIDDSRVLAVNPMLTGRFQWVPASRRRPAGTCLSLTFSGGDELRYADARRMGRWYVVAAAGLDAVPQFGDLGPDALAIDEAEFVERLTRRRGQVKNTLTNQAFVAGIGNAYADEILWQAGIHPHRRGATLDGEARARLFRSMRETLERATAMLTERTRDVLDQSNEEWREHLQVHRRDGEPCPRCGSKIRGQTRGSRETNYCLTCQPLDL